MLFRSGVPAAGAERRCGAELPQAVSARTPSASTKADPIPVVLAKRSEALPVSATRTLDPRRSRNEAEKEGFEPSRQGFSPPNALAGRRLQPLGHFSATGPQDSRALCPLPYGVPRRGGRAVECGGLENRSGRFRPARVQIPPPPPTSAEFRSRSGVRPARCSGALTGAAERPTLGCVSSAT